MTVLIVDKGVDLDSKPSCNSVQIIITEKVDYRTAYLVIFLKFINYWLLT